MTQLLTNCPTTKESKETRLDVMTVPDNMSNGSTVFDNVFNTLIVFNWVTDEKYLYGNSLKNIFDGTTNKRGYFKFTQKKVHHLFSLDFHLD